MVKNLPSVERSTKIRFGKHVPDSNDQEENTVVFNASNVLVPTPHSNAVYLSPIRNRADFTAPEVVLLMYDRNTKEITESGESANNLVGGATLSLAVDRANVTSNTIIFTGGGHDDNNVGFVTDSNVGISNLLPEHTLSVGTNFYVDDTGSNVLVVSGNVAVLRDMVIDGNLRVNGDTTVIYAENTAIKDALIELGQNNTSEDTTLDLGFLMHRPDALSNVVIGYREESDEFAIGYTDTNPTDKTFTPKSDEDINVHVYGLTHVDANIYAHEDLHVSGNTHVTGTGTSTIPRLNVYRTTSSTSKTTGALQVAGGLGVGGDIHATHANLEDVEADSINITDTTASSSKTTGALKVAGGAGIQGDLYAADTTLDSVKALNLATGTLPFTDSTKKLVDSVITQNDDGSIIISANVEIAGNVSVVGNTFALTSNDVVITDRIFDIANNNTSTSLDIGILMEHPGKNIFIGHHTNPQDNFTIGYTSNGCTEDHVEWNGTDHITANVWGYLITQNTVTIEHNDLYVKNGLIGVTTESPVANIHVVGNAFVTSNITTSSNIIVGGTATATSKTTGALQVAGGLGVAGDIHATHANLEDVEADSVNITDTTASTSKTTGALRVAGGVGVQGDIHGSSLYTDDYLIHSGDTDTKIGFPLADTFTVTTANTERLRVNATGATLSTDTSGSSANPELSLYRDQTGSNGNYLGQIRFDGKHDGGNDQLYAKITGKIKKADQGGEDGAIETAIITGGSQRISLRHTGDLFHIKKGTDFQVGETANIYVKTSTSRVGINTDSPAYSLDVQGTSNVGVFTSTDGTITNATASTSKTTGALKVVGGVGVQGDLHADAAYISSNLNVDGTTLHVDSVSNRVGVGKTNPGFTLDVNGDINFSGGLNQGGSPFVSSPWTIAANDDLSYTSGNVTVGTTLFHVDTQTSNIGIGKTDPGFTLDVNGDVNFSGSLYEGGSPFVSTPWTIDGNDLEYTSGNIGIGTNAAAATLHVGGNIYSTSNISAYEIDVANVTTTNLMINTVIVSATTSLENTVTVSNITSNTVQFTNSDVGLVATGNVVANYFKGDGSQLTGIATTLQSVSDFGNTSSNTVQFTNATTGFVTTSNVTVGGIAKQTSVPAFTVRLTDGTIVGAGDIDYNQVDTDNTSSYTTSDGRFTAPVAGHYFFSAHGIYQNDVTVYDFTINGTRQNINALCSSPSANYIQCNISAVLNLSVGDYVNVYQVEGGTFGTDNNVFTGFFIG